MTLREFEVSPEAPDLSVVERPLSLLESVFPARDGGALFE